MRYLSKIAVCAFVILMSISLQAFASFFNLWRASVSLRVSGFKLSATPASQSTLRGENATYIITVTSINDFNRQVELTYEAPSGITATLSPAKVNPPSNGSVNSTLTISTSLVAETGNYSLTVTGKSDTLTDSIKVYLMITALGPFYIEIVPTSFNLMPGESIILTATLKDAYGVPIPGEIMGWGFGGDPLLSGTFKPIYLTDSTGRSFARFTAGEVPCETLIKVTAYFTDGSDSIHAISIGKILPNPPLIIPLLIFGILLLLIRALPHKSFRRALITIFIFGYSFFLVYPLGFSSRFSALVLSAKVPLWFLAGLLILCIMAVSLSTLEQSIKCGLSIGICCWIGVTMGLVLPQPEIYMAHSGIEAILYALKITLMEGLIFNGILVAFAFIGRRVKAIIHPSKPTIPSEPQKILSSARISADVFSPAHVKKVKCRKCGHAIPDSDLYCVYCGARNKKRILSF